MSIETRLRETGPRGGGGGSSDSAGLATNAAVYILSNANAGLANALVLLPGSSATTHISGTNLYINAVTSLFAGSSGLAGKDAVYILSSYNAEYTNALYIRAGSSITTHITGSNLFINALTSAGAGGGQNFFQLLPQQAKLYSSTSAARIDGGTAWWRLLFSNITQQFGLWMFITPPDYGSNPFIRIAWSSDSSITNATSTTWTVEQWGIADNQDRASGIYADTFGGVNSFSVAISGGYSSGTVMISTIPLVTVVSLGATRLTKIRISNTGAAVGNKELSGSTFEYTRA